MLDTILVFCISFGIAWSFVQKLTNEQKPNTLALFSWTFACGVCLLHLSLVEIFRPDSEALANRYWLFLMLHVINLIFIIPLIVIWQLISVFRIANQFHVKCGLTFISWIIYFYMFWRMGSQSPDGGKSCKLSQILILL